MSALRRVDPEEVRASSLDAITPEIAGAARTILDDVLEHGAQSARRWAHELGDITAIDAPIWIDADSLRGAIKQLDRDAREALEHADARIASFARAQRASIRAFEHPVPGGTAAQELAPVVTAGCYAPGGRFPLPSSVLMTARTAREAGVERVVVASPNPSPATLAAAGISGADGLLAIGGAQAIALMVRGLEDAFPPCDAVAGPGNAYVTAAKQLVSGRVRIDMLAGPSELVVVADNSADPETVAADLLAQAEHDPQARPILVALDRDLPERVNAALDRQLATLHTAKIARQACANGFVCFVPDLEQAINITDRLAPEHLELHLDDANAFASRVHHYGAVFVGSDTAEVLGDYGVGPNHTLPTGGTARSVGGLSVFDFLRIRTSITITDPREAEPAYRDAATIARLEGLEAHARSAEIRLKPRQPPEPQ
ncbi:MAG: histidinol dehydrogenase [Planctomycetota bacterium]